MLCPEKHQQQHAGDAQRCWDRAGAAPDDAGAKWVQRGEKPQSTGAPRLFQGIPCYPLWGLLRDGPGGVWPRGRARDSAQSPSITPKLLGGLQDSVSSAEQLFLPAGAAVMDCQGQSRLLLAPRCLPAQVRAGGSQILGQPRAAGEGVGLGEAAEHGSAREGIIWLWGGSGTVWGPGVLGSWIPGVPASRVLAWLPPFPEITACLHDCLQRHGAASAEARMD